MSHMIIFTIHVNLHPLIYNKWFDCNFKKHLNNWLTEIYEWMIDWHYEWLIDWNYEESIGWYIDKNCDWLIKSMNEWQIDGIIWLIDCCNRWKIMCMFDPIKWIWDYFTDEMRFDQLIFTRMKIQCWRLVKKIFIIVNLNFLCLYCSYPPKWLITELLLMNSKIIMITHLKR